MTATDWVQAVAMVVLVGVTIFYAWQAKKARDSAEASARASMRMADEMKEQRLSMYKPHIIPEYLGAARGQHFVEKVNIIFRNERGGSALNADLYLFHQVFRFGKFRYPKAILVGDSIRHDFHVEEPNVDINQGIVADSVATVIVNYEDVSGKPWHSTLELYWDATGTSITPGRMEVAIAGHLDKGV